MHLQAASLIPAQAAAAPRCISCVGRWPRDRRTPAKVLLTHYTTHSCAFSHLQPARGRHRAQPVLLGGAAGSASHTGGERKARLGDALLPLLGWRMCAHVCRTPGSTPRPPPQHQSTLVRASDAPHTRRSQLPCPRPATPCCVWPLLSSVPWRHPEQRGAGDPHPTHPQHAAPAFPRHPAGARECHCGEKTAPLRAASLPLPPPLQNSTSWRGSLCQRRHTLKHPDTSAQ